MQLLERALQAWRTALGTENVVTDVAERAVAERATFRTTQQIPAILRPATREAIQTCLQIASQYQVPIYPISTGKNWGYGSSVPVVDGSVLLDLGKLNRIVAFDEQLAYITVEPGVTFHEVQCFLRERGSRLMLNPTGSSLHTSLIGNALERGISAGPYADRWRHLCGLEAVLPNGEIVRTGFARFENAHAAPVHRWGAGPDIDGLFAQSNLGVVTEMTFWLTPMPGFLQSVLFSVVDNTALAPVLDALQRLKLDGVLNGSVHLYNTVRMMASFMQHPRPEMTLSPALLPAFRHALGISAWTGWMELPSPGATMGRAAATILRDTLAPLVEQIFLFDFHDGPPNFEVEEPLARLAQQLIGHQQSRPREESTLFATYWRMQTPPPPAPDPDRDGCGVLWFAPVTPFNGEHVTRLLNIVEGTCDAFALEPHISLLGISERALIVNSALMFNRAARDEDARALACYDALHERAAAAGYYPYRSGIHALAQQANATDEPFDLRRVIKAAVDPGHILAPGRYGPYQDARQTERSFDLFPVTTHSRES